MSQHETEKSIIACFSGVKHRNCKRSNNVQFCDIDVVIDLLSHFLVHRLNKKLK